MTRTASFSSSPAATAAASPATIAARRARRSRNSSSTLATATATTVLPPTDAAAAAWPVGCEGYVRLRRRAALTWSTRFAVLRGAELYLFYSKQDAALRRNLVDTVALAGGRIAPRTELGLELLARDRREFHARVFSRGDLARWVTAFHRLAVKNEALAAAAAPARVHEPPLLSPSTRYRKAAAGARRRKTLQGSDDATAGATDCSSGGDGASASDDDQENDDEEREPNPVVHDREAAKQRPSGRRRVSFNGSVAVRLIPSLAHEQVAELFYSKEELVRFAAQASSLLSRTEEAVSCARLALQRRAPTLRPWWRSSPAPQQQPQVA
ncbi:hypothetical protein PybrP1_005850 [[Pythium] brassicae (nom. inval.)]|nr:hypothetical protein PybrP1_005850 [[Pythium] brassicae (nom. inval.)]